MLRRWTIAPTKPFRCKLLASGRLNVPLAAVRIASGDRSRSKRVEVRGVTAGMIRALVFV